MALDVGLRGRERISRPRLDLAKTSRARQNVRRIKYRDFFLGTLLKDQTPLHAEAKNYDESKKQQVLQ